MRINQHKRQSTTQRITLRVLRLIARSTNARCEGVVIRHRGKEYGCTNVLLREFATFEGVALPYRECTIPKATVRFLEALADMTMAEQLDTYQRCEVA